MRRRYHLFLTTSAILFLTIASLWANDPIEFFGGQTEAIIRKGEESVLITEGAQVTTGDISISAHQIHVSGDSYSRLESTGDVTVTDTSQNIVMRTEAISYNRTVSLLTSEGRTAVEDNDKGITVEAGWMQYRQKDGHLSFQDSVTLKRENEDGTMVCKADIVSYDRSTSQVVLEGRANVQWKGDTYQASTIRVNLDTDEISMSGDIKGTING